MKGKSDSIKFALDFLFFFFFPCPQVWISPAVFGQSCSLGNEEQLHGELITPEFKNVSVEEA